MVGPGVGAPHGVEVTVGGIVGPKVGGIVGPKVGEKYPRGSVLVVPTETGGEEEWSIDDGGVGPTILLGGPKLGVEAKEIVV